MGVHGLWRLLDASGKPVPLETLEGKVLAIDVSIWIHQVLQGYQDRRGSVVPNAHLLGLFHRICKLLYFKIKPVFVFDGGVPMLKKNTIASRKKQKAIAATKAHQMKHDLIQNLIKHTAVKGALALANGEKKQSTSSHESSSTKNLNSDNDMFKLPSLPSQNESLSDEMIDDYEDYESDSSIELSPRKQSRWIGNIHNVDVTSADFKALPADVRFDVLTDLKETRKQNSWGRLHEMPDESHRFSNFQMDRLLKRRRVQESLEDAEKEMGGKTLTLEELERLLTEQGIETSSRNDRAFRIAADSTTRLIFINDPKSFKSSSTSEENDGQNSSQTSHSSERGISRDSGNDETSIKTTTTESLIADINEYDLESEWDSENEAMMPTNSVEPSPLLTKKYFGKKQFNSALANMLGQAGFPEDEILALMEKSKENSSINDKTEMKEKNETSIKRTALFGSPEKISNIEASSSNSLSDFDALANIVEDDDLPQDEILALIESSREKSSSNDKSDAQEKNEQSIKLTEFFDSLEKISNSEVFSSNSLSDFDKLIKIPKICDITIVGKSSSNDKPESDEKNETLIKRRGISGSPENLSNIEARSANSLSDFDKLIKIPKICDITIVGKSSSNDKPESDEKNETLIKRRGISGSPENLSNSGARSATSLSDFDKLIKIPEICDTKVVEKLSFGIETIENVPSKSDQVEISADTPKLISSDSDTDSDLVEIEDVPIPETNKGLEILVKSDQILKNEDDIFADVFTRDSVAISDPTKRNISKINYSTASTSFHDIMEIPSMRENETASFTEDSKKSEASAHVPIKSQTDELPAIDTPTVLATNLISEPSTSRAEELSDRVAKFKPELLKANQEKLATMEAELEIEHSDLTENIGKLERQATAVTDKMRMEAQDLLRLFGIPYLVAPMEAEAQCAYLESIELTDGTVTDDSDIWLFGGRCVYKNFFNNNKRVMEYKSNDIEHHFKLSRRQMIQLALLVGSDYTVGVSGIGPVTALEILAAFPSEGDDLLRGLANFCSWIRTGRSAGPRRAALRNKLRNVEIEKGFPSQAVVQAYLFPTVDESKESFTWSKPNLTLLADYTRQKFGWTKLKFEETIAPVVKKLAEAKSQKAITSYFKVNKVPKSIEPTMSKRVQKAVKRLGTVADEDENVEETENSIEPTESKKRAGKTSKKKTKKQKQKNEQVVDPSGASLTAEILGEDDTSKVDAAKAGSSGLLARATSCELATTIQQRNDQNIVEEYIPQREKDKANALKKKLRAIEVFRKSKKGSGRSKKAKRPTCSVQKEANLSESSDSC